MQILTGNKERVMKVIQINAVYGYKSTGVIVKDIVKAGQSNGIQMFTAYQTASEDVTNGYKIGNKLDWKYHALYARLTGKQGYASKRATKKLLKWIDSVKPDIVHFHNLHSNYININILTNYLSKNNISTILTLHDCWFFTGKCTHFINVNCDKWKTTCGSCPQLKKEVKSWFADNTSFVLNDKCTHLNSIEKLNIVGCSKWISDLVRQSKLKNNNIQTIYNGVDTSIFKPTETDFKIRYGIADKFVILGMASKWGEENNREGVKKIISSFNEDCVFIIIGCTKIDEISYSEYTNVKTFGYIEDRLFLAEIYSSSDVFVNLTHADTLPTVNMESICCGTPVVTFNVGGSPELIDKDDGFIVAENDFDDVIQCIMKIKKIRCKFSVAEKHMKFDKDKCVEKYIDLYKSLI